MFRVNLFLIGAMKSGSTTLANYLDSHPQIQMSSEKEPGYFVPELWKGRRPEEYVSLFRQCEGIRYYGDASTHYSKLPTYAGVPGRICEYNSNARIIYVMRHPIERAISHYFHNLRDLKYGRETRPPAKAILEDPVYVAYSNYAMQIQPYFDRFGHEKVYPIIFEELKRSPNQTLAALWRWLSVEPVEVHHPEHANQKPEAIVAVRGSGLLNRLRYSSIWSSIAPALPKRIRAIGVRLSQRSLPAEISSADRQLIYDKMSAVMADQVTALEELLDRSITCWNMNDPKDSSLRFTP